MDDDKIKQLFQDFQPTLTSDTAFLNRLQRNLNSVEIVRRQSLQLRRRYRLAVVVAAVVGFVTGFIASYFVPSIIEALTDLCLSLPASPALSIITSNQPTFAWAIVASLSLVFSLTAFDITQTLGLAKNVGTHPGASA